MNALLPRLARWRWPAAGLGLVVAFAVLAGRFWHPYYGFTKFIQLDEADWRRGIPEVREHPVFAYAGFNGYDGAAYAQIAFDPLIRRPELATAIDSLPYRARRILGSALAWLLAGGRPEHIAGTYAALNLAGWLAFAALLWRVLPVRDGRSWLAWAGVVFSAGALHSVRLALTDLLAVALVTAAVGAGERGRPRAALVLLALAGLARETALVAVVALWRGPWISPRAWTANALRAVAVASPLGAWMLYVRSRTGPSDAGFGNFTWPVAGWLEKWAEIAGSFVRHPEFAWLVATTLLATVALTVQAAFLVRRPRGEDAWWRLGMAGVGMMAMLGTAVWEGHPGAATRVLLPMGVAFAVRAVREGAGLAWIAAGSLGACSGVLALWQVPEDPREIAAGRGAAAAFVARIDAGWFGVERGRRASWAWAGGEGTLTVDTAPRRSGPLRVRLRLAAISPREVEVRQESTQLWRGLVGERPGWIEVRAMPAEPGRLRLNVRSAAPPVRESDDPSARALGVALHGVELR